MTTDHNPVLDPADTSYVLPQPQPSPHIEQHEGQGHGEVIVVGGQQARTAALLRGQAVARSLGQRFQVQADSLTQFLAEVRDRLESLDAAIAEDSRAQLKGAVREIGSVVDWCEAVRSEFAYECEQACAGHEPIQLGELCREIALDQHSSSSPITAVVDRDLMWWGSTAALANLVQNALVLVSERTRGNGARSIELQNDDGVPNIRVRSNGEPADTVDPNTVTKFRAATEHVGATVVPDELGAGGAGLVIRLPVG